MVLLLGWGGQHGQGQTPRIVLQLTVDYQYPGCNAVADERVWEEFEVGLEGTANGTLTQPQGCNI